MATPSNRPNTPKPKPTPTGTEKNAKERPAEVPPPATPRKGAEETRMDHKEGSPVQNTRNADRPVDRDLTVEDDAARDGVTNNQQDEDEIDRAQRERDAGEGH